MPRIHDHENEITYFAATNFRHGAQKFGIKTDDRRRHMYVVGKTGMGKTTMIENMVLQDIYNGHGVCYVDPHGDTVEKILDYIPSWRMKDVVYFNPADLDYPVGFNVLDRVSAQHKHLISGGLMGVFKKIWENVWSARMEYILSNTILALLDTPGTTLLGINRMYSDPEYRRTIIDNIKDPVVKQFWVMEYAGYSEKFATEAVAAVQNKVGQFVSSDVIRNIVAQVHSSFDVRTIMDTQKIFLVNLAKGRIGEDNSRLLGGMIITKIQLSAMERVDIPEKTRKDFYLYVDEFQNFATESFANILSEARKYRLNLIVAHQYMAQLAEEVLDAVLGNVGTLVSFRVGAPDAEQLEVEFTPRFLATDIINLAKYHVYLKLMIDGVTSQPFSAITLPPIAKRTSSEAEVIRLSREIYGGDREKIEREVIEWTGLEGKNVDDLMDLARAKGTGNPPKKKYKYKCSWTGKEFSIPVKLDRSRPIYCEEGKEIVREAKKTGAYDARKDLIYDENLEPIGSVAELGTDGLWALKNEEGDIIGRKDEAAVKRDRQAARDTEKKEMAEKIAKVKEEMGVVEEPKPTALPKPGASLDVLKASPAGDQRKKRKRSHKGKPEGASNPVSTPHDRPLTVSSEPKPTPTPGRPPLTTPVAPNDQPTSAAPKKPPTRVPPGKTITFE